MGMGTKEIIPQTMNESGKKIYLYIDSMQLGGAQRVMSNIAEYLARNGHSVTLINDIIPSSTVPEYEIGRNINRVYLDEGNDGRVNKNIYRIRRLRKLVKTDRPDVVLSFLGPPNIRMLVATMGLRCKKIVSVRNDPYREYGDGIKKTIARNVFRLADGCVFQTQDAASYFPKRVRDQSRIIVNPVNEKFYHTEWIGDEKEIAVVGRLQAQKNPLLALEAFHQIERGFPDYKIVFYGDEGLAADIKQRSKEYCIEDKVVVFGKSQNIEEKLAHSKLYMLSSDFEGMPNALLEAMAVGVPAISTDCPCGGPRTVIQNEMQGILVPCRDAKKMAEAMKRILSDASLQNEMSMNERDRSQEFRHDKVMGEWMSFINA